MGLVWVNWLERRSRVENEQHRLLEVGVRLREPPHAATSLDQ